jgi:hypothetical protein
MRLPRVRFTVRRLMIAVAIVGLMLGLTLWMKRRSAEFQKKARFYDGMFITMFWQDHSPPPGLAHNLWVGEMATKYRYAASYPWWPVEPDPPEPEL